MIAFSVIHNFGVPEWNLFLIVALFSIPFVPNLQMLVEHLYRNDLQLRKLC